jgi:serine/threonine protein kinase
LHGDIKPQNVLVFGSDGKYTAKVADYGFSSLKQSGDVALAISRPWEAPELIECDCSPLLNFTAAKRAEAYSFGLLCLWLLFNQYQIENSEMTICNLFTSEGVHKLQTLKAKGRILDLVLSALASSREISATSKDQLGNAFQSLLQVDPLHRNSKLEDFLLRLESNSDRFVNDIACNDQRLIEYPGFKSRSHRKRG